MFEGQFKKKTICNVMLHQNDLHFKFDFLLPNDSFKKTDR